MEIAFKKFDKIPRLRRDIVITEKIDGTNGQIILADESEITPDAAPIVDAHGVRLGGNTLLICGSRNRYITPNNDNYGFARWAWKNADRLLDTLGYGRHYGEWWGNGIQRGYDMGKKVFSLFNTKRFDRDSEKFKDEIRIVPVLYEGAWSDRAIADALMDLANDGSVASPGFMRPEGVVIYHKAANSLYKVTLERDGGKWRLDG